MRVKNRVALTLAHGALFAALMCILSPLALPVGPVPITLGAFAVMLTGAVLDVKSAALAVVGYLLLGAVGLPVFSGGGAGMAVLTGPTGGYLWAYLPMVIIIAALGRPHSKQTSADGGGTSGRFAGAGRTFAACLLSMAVLYLLGTLQFTIVAQCGWREALSACVAPFVLFDVIKAACASLLGVRLRARLRAAGLM